MSDTSVIIIVVIFAFLAIIAFFLSWSIYIVQQAQGIVIERFGKFQKILTPGINFTIPFIDSTRRFAWRKLEMDSQGGYVSTDTTLTRIDLRESVFNFPIQEVYTRDTILLDVNSIMYYRIFDFKKAIYEVDDLNTAISNVAQTQLKEVFGNMTFTEALASQESINKHMKEAFGPKFSEWGVHVERMELLDMTPKPGTTITNAMKRQMIAERTRRAEFITAEGSKAAMRLISEGTKLEMYNIGVAEQESTRKRSEGEAGARVEIARAESKSLDLIASAFQADGASQTEYMISQRYLDLLRSLNVEATKKIFLPYETKGLSGLVGGLKGVYGREKAVSLVVKKRKVIQRSKEEEEKEKEVGRTGAEYDDLS